MSLLWKSMLIDEPDSWTTFEKHRITGAVRDERKTHKRHYMDWAWKEADRTGQRVPFLIDGYIEYANPPSRIRYTDPLDLFMGS
jgi:hypothetical protein